MRPSRSANQRRPHANDRLRSLFAFGHLAQRVYKIVFPLAMDSSSWDQHQPSKHEVLSLESARERRRDRKMSRNLTGTRTSRVRVERPSNVVTPALVFRQDKRIFVMTDLKYLYDLRLELRMEEPVYVLNQGVSLLFCADSDFERWGKSRNGCERVRHQLR